MPPKPTRTHLAPSYSPSSSTPRGYLSTVWNELTAAENQSVVRAIGIFGVAVAFFSSSWSEVLIPPV